MTSKQTSSACGGSKRHMLQTSGAVLGALMVVVGAGMYGFRFDRAPYQLTAVKQSVDVSLDKTQGIGRLRTVTLTFKNIGRYPLKIARVHTSCGCTVVDGLPDGVVPPDGTSHFDVTLTMPLYEDKRSSVWVETDPPSELPVEVSIVMHGATLETPYVNWMPQSFEVTTRMPDEPIEQLIEIETGETADSSAWLSGLSTGSETVKVELLKREVLPKEPAPGVVNCRYLFRLTLDGPMSPYAPISLPIQPIGTSEVVAEPDHCVMSVVYRPLVEVSPQRVLIVAEDHAEFPQWRSVILWHANNEPLPPIQDVDCSADWVSLDVRHGEQNSNRRLVNVKIDEPSSSEAATEVKISFADQSSPVTVPIRLVKVISARSSTPAVAAPVR